MDVVYISPLFKAKRDFGVPVQAYAETEDATLVGVGIKIAGGDPVVHFGSEAQLSKVLGDSVGRGQVVMLEDGLQEAYVLNRRLGFDPEAIIDLNSIARINQFFAEEDKEGQRTIELEVVRFGAKFPSPTWSNESIFDAVAQERSKVEEYIAKRCHALRWLIQKMSSTLPASEIAVISDCIKSFSSPLLEVDGQQLDCLVDAAYADFDAALEAVFKTLPEVSGWSSDQLLSTLRSDQKLHGLLTKAKANPPAQVSFSKDSPWVETKLKSGSLGVIKLLQARVLVESNWNDVERAKKIREASRFTNKFSIGLRYFGAVTSRIQVDGRDRINFQGAKGDSIAKNSLRAPAGKFVFSADYRGIELRIALHTVGDREKLDYIRAGGDLYKREASGLMSTEYNEITGEQRDTAKEVVISGIYGASGDVIRKGLFKNKRIRLGEEEGKELCESFRLRNPLITKAWAEGDRFLKLAINGKIPDGYTLFNGNAVWNEARQGLELPNGLIIQLPNIRQTQKGIVYGPENTSIYGAKIFQNVIQGLGRSILSPMWNSFRDSGRRIFHSVHDSVFWIADKNAIQAEIDFATEAMCKPVPWMEGLPLDVEIEAGPTLGSMRPTKVVLSNLEPKQRPGSPSRSRLEDCKASP